MDDQIGAVLRSPSRSCLLTDRAHDEWDAHSIS
jgi:hypothetical protein